METQGGFSESILRPLQERKIVKCFPLSLQSTSLVVVNTMNTLIYSVLNFFYSSVVWLPTSRLKRLVLLKVITTCSLFYSQDFPQHIIFGHITKSQLKSFTTQMFLQRFNNLQMIKRMQVYWRLLFIKFTASCADGSLRAVPWPSDILYFSPALYQGWSVAKVTCKKWTHTFWRQGRDIIFLDWLLLEYLIVVGELFFCHIIKIQRSIDGLLSITRKKNF